MGIKEHLNISSRRRIVVRPDMDNDMDNNNDMHDPCNESMCPSASDHGTAEDANKEVPEPKKRHGKQKPFHVGNMRGTQLGDTKYILAKDIPLRHVIDSVIRPRTIKLSKKVADAYGIDENVQAHGIDVYEWKDLQYATSVQYPRVVDMEKEHHLKDDPKTLRKLLDFYHIAGDTYQRNRVFTGNNASRLLRLIMACVEANRIDDEHETDLIDHLFDSLDEHANALDVEDEFNIRWLVQNFNNDEGLGDPVCSEILMLLQYLVDLACRGSNEVYKILCDSYESRKRTTFNGFDRCSQNCGHSVISQFTVNGKDYIVSVCTDPADGTPPHIHVTDSEHFDRRDGNDMRVSLLDGGIFPDECFVDDDVILALHNSLNTLKVYGYISDRSVLSGYQRCLESMRNMAKYKSSDILINMERKDPPKIFPAHQTNYVI